MGAHAQRSGAELPERPSPSHARLGAEQFVDRAVRLIYRNVRVGPGPGVGISNGDTAKAGASDHLRLLVRGQFGLPQRVVFWRIAVRPTIYCYGRDIGCRIESASCQHPAELGPDIA